MDQRKGESAAFWHQKYDEVKEELEEYQSSSRELEQELETQLAQSEKKRKELEATLERVKEENDGLKSKLSQVVSESQKQINQLQKDLNHYQATNESLSRAIRELEQSNDDLERAKRALIASLEDFEGRLNQQIEKNVLLENELGDKEELEVVVQRLKDEARDLKYELTLQRQKEPKNVSTSHDNRRSSLLEGCSPPVRSPSSNSVVGVNNTSVNSKPRALSCHSSTVVDEKLNCSPSPMKQPRAVPQRLTPTSRITALSAVNDLFRKVGPIEPKLDSCRR